MKLGLLMEAAHANQKLADASLKKLRSASQEMLEAIRDDVRRLLLEELRSLTGDAQHAADALQHVKRVANLRIAIWSLGLTLLCSIVPLGVACWIVPSQSDIAVLRARYSGLRSNIATLEAQGGGVELRRCGEGARLCVRVDRTAPAYGERSDFLVVKGY